MSDPLPGPFGSPPELVLFVGVQGSGKTSFYRQRFSGTHVHVSKDLFPNNRNKARRQRQLIAEALVSGRSVVVDNTNPTREDRAGAMTLAREHGATVTGYVFVTDLAAALERNRRREGKARVPDVAIYAAAKRLQPPSPEEGFDTLFAVRLTPAGGFEVAPRRPEEQS
ncbi:putative kinase [Deinococcus aerius]|uniref:Putative kinase n=1 Tax=Deinococcus aerius TaxID=200253 RepID=A0A2I9DVC8_9DEIO|nr:ATP-binding protein [Deinococcus aerius]GBF04395.1 putative kinase [Deinococcus aerius]